MANDRGGLDYLIKIRDSFTTPLKRFRAEIAATKASLEGLKGTGQAIRGLGKDLNDAARQARGLRTESSAGATEAQDSARKRSNAASQTSKEERDAAKAQRDRARALKANLDEEARIRKTLGGIQKKAIADEKRAVNDQIKLEKNRQAQARAAASNAAAASKEAQQAQKRSAATAASAARAEAASAKTRAKTLKDLRSGLLGANSAGNRLVFTLRSIIGVAAGLALFQTVTRGFSDLVKGGIQFNASLESSRIGIAGLITAVADVRDANGELAKGPEAFSLASKLATDQMDKLRQEVLNTTASMDELVDTFQVAAAPGFAAGLNLDQIRELAVRVSQAAATLKVPQNQLSEEIRAVLTGNITGRTTRIATALSLTPEEVRTALSSGKLFDLLQDKFNAFALSAAIAGKSFEGSLNRVRNAFRFLAGEASTPLFDELKQSLKETFALLTETDVNTGKILPNPQAIKVLRILFQGLADAVRLFREGIGDISLGSLESGAQSLAAVFKTLGAILLGLTKGAVSGFSFLGGVIEAISSSIGGISPEVITAVVQAITSMATVLVSASLGVGALQLALNLVLSPFRKIVGAVKVTQSVLKLLPGPVKSLGLQAGLWGAALIAAGFAVKALASHLLGIDLEFSDLPEVIGSVIENVATRLFGFIDLAGAQVSAKFQQAMNQIVTTTENTFDRVKGFFDFNLGGSPELARLAAKEREQAIQDRNNKLAADNLALQNEIEESELRSETVKANANKRQEERITKLRQEVETRDEINTGIEHTLKLQRAQEALGSFFDDVEIGSAEGRGTPISNEQKLELANTFQRVQGLELEAKALERINDLKDRPHTDQEVVVAGLENELGLLQGQLATMQVINALELERATTALGGAQGEDEKLKAELDLLAVKRENTAEEARLKANIKATATTLRDEANKLGGGVFGGLQAAAKDFGQQFGDGIAAGIAIATGLINGFAGFVSNTIVDAFDPTKEFDLREAFARFLQDIARLIIAEMTKVAIAKAILGLGFSEGGSVPGLAGGGSVPSFKKGGRVPGFASGGGVLSASHYGISAPRPKGVAPSDTVPAWLTPGEHIMPVNKVLAYGADLLEAMRRGSIDPATLRSAAGLNTRKALKNRNRRVRGFAQGGPVGDAAVAALTPTLTPSAAAPSFTPAVVVSSDQAMDRLLAGGDAAMMRYIKANASKIDGMLSRTRPRR